MRTIKRIIFGLVAVSVLMVSCKSMNKTQKGAVIGTAGGAAVGGVIGKAAGNTALGVIIGATVGGVTGAVIGKKMDKQAEEIKKQVPDAKVERVEEGIIVEFNSKILFGFDRSDLPPNTVLKTPEVYPIPLRSCYSKNITNLMMAGRNISATHAAFTSSRVMATCATIGQAVGTAAALCVEKSKLPRQLAEDKQLVSVLQQRLIRDDQTIKGRPGELLRNEDTSDLARTASISSSAISS